MMEIRNDPKEEKMVSIKLDEMRFQYQAIENNHSRLINKCSIAMVGICAILGSIGLQANQIFLLQISGVLIIISVILLITSLVFLLIILIGYIQPFISHQQIEQDPSPHLVIIERLTASYSKILTKLKDEVTKSQNNYKKSLILLVASVILILFSFFFSKL